ncbi:MAG: hypothetical protein JRJ87_13930 [Deltaproteobacteria bacterium]|nr:hypothetical protein [Deltaproteobacteria bacterium]
MKKLFLVIILSFMAIGCRSVPVAGECSETSNIRCMTKKVCDYDKKRGCMKCMCESDFTSDRFKQHDQERGRSIDGDF